MAEDKKPFWRTAPGILTQVAGIVTALGAIAGVVSQTGIFKSSGTGAQQAGIVGSAPTAKGQPIDAWVSKANTICEHAIETYQGLPQKVTINVLASQVDIGWRKVEGLRGLTEPSTEKVAYRKFIATIGRQMEAIERRYLLTRNYQQYSRDDFARQFSKLRTKIGDLNEQGDALAVQLGATVCAREPY
jgi:hypothetical protein